MPCRPDPALGRQETLEGSPFDLAETKDVVAAAKEVT